jgi:hypothetical protein
VTANEVAHPTAAALIEAAADALKARRDEVNRLNVFPVPDGDTGTNMSLTMDAVVAEVRRLRPGATLGEICQAVTHGSLMGARGNSGVILSQILRGLCEGLAGVEHIDAPLIASALDKSVTVAFQAVRRPVEGTMLTVLRDAATAAVPSAEAGDDITTLVEKVVASAFDSVRRTPDLLPVLREAGVVDAGGYGVAILAEGVAAGLSGHEIRSFDVSVAGAEAVEVGEGEEDWEGQRFLYCTEFLLFGQGLDRDTIEKYLTGIGDSELVVGTPDQLKVHVHTDEPATVLGYALGLGEVVNVHVNNMRLQTRERSERLRAESQDVKELGFVAVAAGKGLEDILRSLGVDVVVAGGQTMNPSTQELLRAIEAVQARSVIVLPNNRNIILAANQTIGIAGKPVAVVPTTAVPQAFSAMLAADPTTSLEQNVAAMTAAAEAVRTAEITTAIKDSKAKAGAIKAGQVIGVSEHEIEAVGDDVATVAKAMLDVIEGDAETLTLIAGEQMTDDELATIAASIGETHPELEVETHRGDQPLYALLMAAE